jgi:hypothetical protein
MGYIRISLLMAHTIARPGQAWTHMEKKQSHCVPTWRTPSSPAKHARPLISWQQATSWAVDGNTRMLAKAEVPDVTPSSTK